MPYATGGAASNECDLRLGLLNCKLNVFTEDRRRTKEAVMKARSHKLPLNDEICAGFRNPCKTTSANITIFCSDGENSLKNKKRQFFSSFLYLSHSFCWPDISDDREVIWGGSFRCDITSKMASSRREEKDEVGIRPNFSFPLQPNDVNGPQPWSKVFLTGSRDARAVQRVSREEKKRERNRERGLPVISVTAEAFSEGITPDHPLAYLQRLDAALSLLGDRLHFW
ncbi:hypothetical protein M9H77_34018 [Catharanthus roseus]|uniref:Uncharacterized protein n=1 Tax=Catharanthus roseus TaxID=4058 RepID=A0ACB9ZKQ3_CATRO|nr:hypothetical protein M9H77_34018 [Catharanthus roseus]